MNFHFHFQIVHRLIERKAEAVKNLRARVILLPRSVSNHAKYSNSLPKQTQKRKITNRPAIVTTHMHSFTELALPHTDTNRIEPIDNHTLDIV